ncbi:hypothetical protein BGZ76_004710 [Entomortierella beljakovae]|nr:hypothetical protein BGZ76_004710 [Entomortierella beljakovae]
MYLPWSIFVLSIFNAAFQFLLLVALGSFLSIYSKFGGQYANSIRWAYNGGFLDMIQCLFNNRKNVPLATKLVLGSTIIAAIVAVLADKGTSRYITPAVSLKDLPNHLAISQQYSSQDSLYQQTGWSTIIPFGTSISDSMNWLINSTRNIPNVSPGVVYTPLKSPYDVTCNSLNLLINGTAYPEFQSPDGCMDVNLVPMRLMTSNEANLNFTYTSPGRWSFNVPWNSFETRFLFAHKLSVYTSFNGTKCGIEAPLTTSILEAGFGVITLPRTFALKCTSGNQQVVVSHTVTLFSNHTDATGQGYSGISKKAFSGDDDLLQAMGNVLQQDVTSSPLTKTMFFELKTNKSTIDILICTSSNEPPYSGKGASCLYSNINVAVIKPSQIDPSLQSTSGDIGSSPTFILDHYPFKSDLKMVAFTIPELKARTDSAAGYLSSLGQNVFTNGFPNVLYVAFATGSYKVGLEIPGWLFYTMVVTMGVCGAIWIGTIFTIPGEHRSSLYASLTSNVAKKIDTSAPLLVQATANPLEIVGVDLSQHDHLKEKSSSDSHIV